MHELREKIKSLYYRWKYRNDTPAQRQAYSQRIRTELRQSIQDLKEDLKSEPASRELYDAFHSLDEVSTVIDEMEQPVGQK